MLQKHFAVVKQGISGSVKYEGNDRSPFSHLAYEDIFLQRYGCPHQTSNPLQKIFLNQVERIFCPEFALLVAASTLRKAKNIPSDKLQNSKTRGKKIRAYGTHGQSPQEAVGKTSDMVLQVFSETHPQRRRKGSV